MAKGLTIKLKSDNLGAANVLHRKDVPKDILILKEALLNENNSRIKELDSVKRSVNAILSDIRDFRKVEKIVSDLKTDIIDNEIIINNLLKDIYSLQNETSMLVGKCNTKPERPWYDYILRLWK